MYRLVAGWVFRVWLFTMSFRLSCVAGFSELKARMDAQTGSRTKAKKYSRKNMLSKRMLSLHPAYRDFVSGSKTGAGTHFHCLVCKRDVAMGSQGSREFARHFQSDSHWDKDVVYRVHMGMPVLNKLMEPLQLSEEQLAEYRAKPFVELGTGYPFPEDLLPKHSRVESKIPFMTFVGCLCDLLRCGGDFALVRQLWSHFCVSLDKQKADFTLHWSRSESVVSCVFGVFVFPFIVWSLRVHNFPVLFVVSNSVLLLELLCSSSLLFSFPFFLFFPLLPFFFRRRCNESLWRLYFSRFSVRGLLLESSV